uniref:Uncharacterized protein n=1 Tax=Aplanochytrium stocchinoi TaxID=215587 RepID=A0A7S3UZH1_9STRA|mmetsp:Transcript_620/g.750  ORF Transcript_620/g.750 Transcript_620/m.750 type:complete len:328 (-) Transcript_620:190-1173(-)
MWTQKSFSYLNSRCWICTFLLTLQGSFCFVHVSYEEDRSIIHKDGYNFERYALSMLLIYAVGFVLGSARNKIIINRCMARIVPLFEKQFAQLGWEVAKTNKKLLQKESQNVYMFYSTGRRFCKGCLCVFHLKPRQDLLSSFFNLFFPDVNHDFMSIDIPMNEADMDSFLFSIVRQNQLNSLCHIMTDLATYPRQVPLEFLPKTLCCLTDWDELVDKLMPSSFKQTIRKCEPSFELMHLSDQNRISYLSLNDVPKKALRFRFRIPPVERLDSEMIPLLKMVFEMIDLVGKLHLPEDANSKILRQSKSKMEQRRRANREGRRRNKSNAI